MSEISTILALGIFATLVLLLGWRRGFFFFHFKEWEVPVRFFHVIGAFLIYFIITLSISTIALSFYKQEIQNDYLTYSSWFNFLLSLLILIFLAIYLRCLPASVRKGVLFRSGEKHSPATDLSAAAFSWLMAFPLVLFLGQLLEYVVTKIFQLTSLPDQVAVKFLKSTFEHPTYFILATVSIVILAPLIEETLFRGFLQSFIRQHIGSKQAILITSVCFSLFHYSSGQGFGNISIILSLFVLSLFLGYLYEKQGSILANMFLHAGFNTISVINLYFFGGFTTGL